MSRSFAACTLLALASFLPACQSASKSPPIAAAMRFDGPVIEPMVHDQLPDGREFFALRSAINGKQVCIVVGGLSADPRNGIPAPCPDLKAAPDQKIEVAPVAEESSDGNALLKLSAGFAWVYVHDPAPPHSASSASEVSRKPNVRIRWITPWRIVVTKSMATGAYGTEYCVLQFPDDKAYEDTRQRVYAVTNAVSASSPIPTANADSEPQERWSSEDYRETKRVLWHSALTDLKSSKAPPPSDCDNKGHKQFLDDARKFYNDVATHLRWDCPCNCPAAIPANP